MYEPREIDFKFDEDLGWKVDEGLKGCSTRLEPKAEAGDYFTRNGRKFIFTKVEVHSLGWIADNLYIKEGFSSPEDFIDRWNKIYGTRAPYTRDQLRPVHHFREAKN
jgi:hypothetical protein